MYDRIWLLMMQHHMNKSDLAKKIGISSGNFSDWVSGRSNPSTKKIVSIADYFNVSLDWLLERDTRFPVSNPEYFNLVTTYSKLDDQGKAVVMGIAYQQLQRCTDAAGSADKGGSKDENNPSE